MFSDGHSRKKSPKVAFLELYDALERKLKRHAPRDYITWMSKRLAESWEDSKKLTQTPPHRIIHSIEANCAYWKQGYRDEVTWKAVAGIMNIYHNFTDPYQLNTISESLDRTFLLMYREQIPLQKRASWAHFLRSWALFVSEVSMKKSRDEFSSQYSIKMDQWVKVCLLCWMISLQEAGGSFLVKVIENPKIMISQETLNQFLRYSAMSPKEIGNYFLDSRRNEPYESHSLIQSCFFKKPIVIFSDNSIIVPHTHLLFLHAGEGLYRLAHTLDSFPYEFSESFEKYTRRILDSLEDVVKIIDSKMMEKNATGKSCDFLVETKNTIILVECKACLFTANRLTNNAIENNSSTGKVARGLIQLYNSAMDLENGRFEEFGIGCNKPTIGIVLTFGEIPSANSEWYFDEFFLKRADKKLGEEIYPSKQMSRRPIILNISDFESLIVILNTENITLQDLYDKKQKDGYHATGDWGIWLVNQYDSGNFEILPFLQDIKTQFLNELGILTNTKDGRIETELRFAKFTKTQSNSPI